MLNKLKLSLKTISLALKATYLYLLIRRHKLSEQIFLLQRSIRTAGEYLIQNNFTPDKYNMVMSDIVDTVSAHRVDSPKLTVFASFWMSTQYQRYNPMDVYRICRIFNNSDIFDAIFVMFGVLKYVCVTNNLGWNAEEVKKLFQI